MQAKRLLKNVDVQFISLVSAGANGKSIIWKSATAKDNPPFNHTIEKIKLNKEEKIVYGIVYSPDEVDTDGDTMTAKEIKKMAYNFMANKRIDKVDDSHDYNPDDGYVAESWILKSNDPVFPNEKPGSWAVGIKVTNDETWEKVKKGDISGLSMAGNAEYELLKSDNPKPDVKKSFFDRFKEKIGLKKGLFRGAMLNDQMYNAMNTFWNVVDSILWDNLSDDAKINLLLDAIKELQQYVESGFTLAKSDKNQTNTEEISMTKEELSEVLKPLQDTIEELKKSVEDQKASSDELSQRLEKVEKFTQGKQSVDDDGDTADVQKSDSDFIWTRGMGMTA